jgi:hypothetical protein
MRNLEIKNPIVKEVYFKIEKSLKENSAQTLFRVNIIDGAILDKSSKNGKRVECHKAYLHKLKKGNFQASGKIILIGKKYLFIPIKTSKIF